MDPVFRFVVRGPALLLLGAVVWLAAGLLEPLWGPLWAAVHGFVYNLLFSPISWQLAHWWWINGDYVPLGTFLVLLGAAVGLASPKHWLGNCLCVAVAPLLLPLYIAWLIPGQLTVIAPYYLTGIALALAAAWLGKSVRTRPYPPGHCPGRGYALRGLTSDTCPECGAPVASSSARAV